MPILYKSLPKQCCPSYMHMCSRLFTLSIWCTLINALVPIVTGIHVFVHNIFQAKPATQNVPLIVGEKGRGCVRNVRLITNFFQLCQQFYSFDKNS